MRDKIIEKALFFTALSASIVLFLIAFFIFQQGVPLIFKVGIDKFLLSLRWAPSKSSFGILPFIIGSFFVTAGALIISVPFGLGCAIFLAEFSPKLLSQILKPVIELLAGIPSVVYGFVGVIVLAPLIRSYLGGPGLSILTAGIILAIMVLPTIISISYDAIVAVPNSYREGSLALGATRWQTVTGVVLRAARSGIIASLILGIGRAVGETMAVIMVAGNAIKLPSSILAPTRTLTSNIALEMAYATGMHRQALFATGVILFLIIMVINSIAYIMIRREE
ncbi:MAG: phosphate ABC transporter permease subunit PstC [candidate division WOR-3 bacterium]